MATTTAIVLAIVAPARAQQSMVDAGKTPGQDVIALAPNGLEHALAALPELTANILERSGVPGAAVAVVHGGKTVFAQGFGVRELGKPGSVGPNTVFQVASLSKPLTASVTAVEVSKGRVAWDDPVAKHLPGFALRDPYVSAHATIGDFMAHRTGLPAAAGDDLEDLGFERDEIIKRLGLLPLDAFRASYHYANFGTTIGALAAAAAAGMAWEDLAEQALFQPLGMTSTSARHADYLARPDRAVLHALDGGAFRPLYDRNPDQQSPAGGVSSSANDLALWLKFLLADGKHQGQPLATPASLLAAMSPQSFSAPAQSVDSRPGFYGYGFNTSVNANGRTTFSHSGAFLLGAGSAFQIIPSADVGIVVLTNGSPVGAAESIGMRFMDLVQYGEPLRDWYAAYNGLMQGLYTPDGDLAGKTPPVQARAPQPLSAYAGHYENAYFGSAEISVDKQELVLTLGPKAERIVLAHWDGDTYAMTPRGENAPEGTRSSVHFNVQDGKAGDFTIDYLDDNGLATWKR
ncbi:MAG TPA: serine hydrolase [Candidimonas sp.]|nr:serine hydrolase [Candidimonas sp.]